MHAMVEYGPKLAPHLPLGTGRLNPTSSTNELTERFALNVKDMFAKALAANKAATTAPTAPPTSEGPGVASRSTRRAAEPMDSPDEPIPKLPCVHLEAWRQGARGKGQGARGKGKRSK